jgi:hypothetical protein
LSLLKYRSIAGEVPQVWHVAALKKYCIVIAVVEKEKGREVF